MSAREYQLDQVEATAQALTMYRKVCVQLDTGGGKTFEFSLITQRYISNPENGTQQVVIAVHRKNLLKQTRKTLWSMFSISAQPIEAGMKFLPKARVYVGMVDMVNKLSSQLENPGLLIIDEAHEGIQHKLHDKFKDALIIGFTATPKTVSLKRPMKQFYETIVVGPGIAYLIEWGKKHPGEGLCQNITRAPKDVVDRRSLTTRGNDFDENFMAESYSRTRFVKNTVNSYKRFSEGEKTIIANVNVAHSLLVRDAFIEAGYKCKHIDANTPDKERDEVYKWFAETEDAILCNVGLVIVGFDEPTVRTVIANFATKSVTKWLQFCGRGSRPIAYMKSTFTITDMGGNAAELGDWNAPRNWEDEFYHPKKPGKGTGVAPIKICDQCEAVVPAQVRVCPFCEYVFPQKVSVEIDLHEFIVMTKNIDVEKIMDENRSNKFYAPFFAIGREIINTIVATDKEMTDEKAVFISSKFKELGREWIALVNRGSKERKTFSIYKQQVAENFIYRELLFAYPKWVTDLAKRPKGELPEAVGRKYAPLQQVFDNAKIEKLKNLHYGQ